MSGDDDAPTRGGLPRPGTRFVRVELFDLASEAA